MRTQSQPQRPSVDGLLRHLQAQRVQARVVVRGRRRRARPRRRAPAHARAPAARPRPGTRPRCLRVSRVCPDAPPNIKLQFCTYSITVVFGRHHWNMLESSNYRVM